MNNELRLPKFLIVGAAKSGTTSLYNYLTLHPEIFLPEEKEPCFFSSYRLNKEDLMKNIYPVTLDRIIININRYLSLFAHVSELNVKTFGEASTHYLFQYNQTIKNIKYLYKEAIEKLKIIIVLRNPIEAAFSNHTMWVMKGKEKTSFDDAINDEKKRYNNGFLNIAYIHKFSYDQQIKAYLNTFKHVKIILFDDLLFRSDEVIKEILNFLNVDDSFVPDNLGMRYNISGKIKMKSLHRFLVEDNLLKTKLKPLVQLLIPFVMRLQIRKKLMENNVEKLSINERTKSFLLKQFTLSILNTQKLIGRNLSTWLC